ncbi:nSTAND3 domain-containing NTPase [Streptomyces sp. TE33382]
MSEETPPDEAVRTSGRPEPATPGETPESTAGGAADEDGPVSESDALRSLTSGGEGEAERAEALRAGAIADRIAERLNADGAGTTIGTLALFNDSVSFGGAFNLGGRGGSASAGGPGTRNGTAVRLTEDEIAAHTELYVHPECYDDALESLRTRHLLLLSGPPGSGRTAAAVNLLAEALTLNGAEDGGCHLILDPMSIAAPEWEPPAEHSGCLAVLDDGLPETMARALTGAASKLRAAKAHLVLVGGPGLEAAVYGHGGEDIARHGLHPVDPVVLLERRVLGHSGDLDRKTELSALLKTSGAMAALRERPQVAQAARLASVITAGGDLPAAVAALRDPSEQVYTWFRTHHEPEAVAFAVAVAVLEGSGYLTVADAAVGLRKDLSPVDVAPPDIRFRDRLAHDQPWIELVFPGPGDPPGSPRVRFRSALVRHAVLTYAWTTLDGRREAVLQWLRRLLRHADIEVRAQAAVSAGVLARADYHYAFHRFVKSWAGSTSWPVRQAAATTLGVAGSTPATEEPVWELLHQWVRGGHSAYERRLASTAANTVGGLFGRNAPGRALELLRSALDRGDDWGTLTPVAWSGVHLIHHGRTAEVLAAYLDWSRPQDTSPLVLKTLSSFVFAVSTPYASVSPDGVGPADSVDGVPLLLSAFPRHRVELAELWARALARKPVQEKALEALRVWIDTHADACPGGLAALRTLVLDIAGAPGKHRERLFWWLSKWASDKESPSAHAAALARLLDR